MQHLETITLLRHLVGGRFGGFVLGHFGLDLLQLCLELLDLLPRLVDVLLGILFGLGKLDFDIVDGLSEELAQSEGTQEGTSRGYQLLRTWGFECGSGVFVIWSTYAVR